MEHLKMIAKDWLIARMISAHDWVRNQSSKVANAMGGPNEAVERANLEQFQREFDNARTEILRRIPDDDLHDELVLLRAIERAADEVNIVQWKREGIRAAAQTNLAACLERLASWRKESDPAKKKFFVMLAKG